MNDSKKAKYNYITEEEIRKLKGLTSFLSNKINENPTLDKKLNLRGKFMGVLGEALGLIRIFKNYGNSYKYAWYGGGKKDFDLEMIKNNKSIRFQIKTTILEPTKQSETGKGLFYKWRMNEKHENIICPNLYYCFIRLTDKSPKFYIVPSKIVAKNIRKESEIWKRLHNWNWDKNKTRHIRIKVNDNEKCCPALDPSKYENKWEFFD